MVIKNFKYFCSCKFTTDRVIDAIKHVEETEHVVTIRAEILKDKERKQNA